ncbi:MAG: hypothetical protein ACK4ZA_02210 [Tsuneonella troitsensis]
MIVVELHVRKKLGEAFTVPQRIRGIGVLIHEVVHVLVHQRRLGIEVQIRIVRSLKSALAADVSLHGNERDGARSARNEEPTDPAACGSGKGGHVARLAEAEYGDLDRFRGVFLCGPDPADDSQRFVQTLQLVGELDRGLARIFRIDRKIFGFGEMPIRGDGRRTEHGGGGRQ